MAKEMLDLHEKEPNVGAEVVANALKALSNIYEECRMQKLTRNQHILMRLGELSAWGESAAGFCRKAAEEKYSRAVKFDRETWQAMARVYARDCALQIGT
jgi:hypothetical protein